MGSTPARAGGSASDQQGRIEAGDRERDHEKDVRLDTDQLIALGVYDPSDEHAELRLELLNYLLDLGASAGDLVAYERDSLPGLAAVLAIRDGPFLTLNEVAEGSELEVDEIRRIVRAAGFPDPDPDTPAFTQGFSSLLSSGRDAVEIFGEHGFYQLVRVMGAAMARVADAVVSAFLVEIEPDAEREDPVGLAVARANVEAASLLPLVPTTLDVLFRQHLLLAQRPYSPLADRVGFETQQLVVGFVDLVGSAELAEELSISELGALLGAFEEMALDTVTQAWGRVVKLIGDEVLFTAPDPAAACRIALELAAACDAQELLPAAHVGLAGGSVMLREGDVFGPVVNLAARFVKEAEPGQVVTTEEIARSAGCAFEAIGHRRLKGMATEAQLVALTRP
jgi:class 3 adenylate cyclase